MPNHRSDEPPAPDAAEPKLDDDPAQEFTDDRTAVTKTRKLSSTTVRELKYREEIREVLDKTHQGDE